MRLLTPDQALLLDQRARDEYGLTSEKLIPLAADALVRHLQGRVPPNDSVLVLAGPGHNGDDGREFAQRFRGEVTVRTLGRHSPQELRETLSRVNWVVDALFGVGLNRPLKGDALEWVETLNAEKLRRPGLRILAVDVPSGLNALTGWPQPAAVRADETLTFQAAKPGFYQNEGPEFTGRVFIAPLSYPPELFREVASSVFAHGIAAAAKLIPRRPSVSNKGTYSQLQLVAGSARYPGAAVLAIRGALRGGVGSVRLHQDSPSSVDWQKTPEVLFQQWDPRAPFDRSFSWVVGPGLDEEFPILSCLRTLREAGVPHVVVDATALNVLSQSRERWPSTWLLTPHPKEIARLLSCKVDEVQKDRLAAATEAQARFGATVLLKGYKTVIASRGRCDLILRGNSALAKAGSGDVLAGLIGALLAQGLETRRAAVLGALIQGIAADLWLHKGDAASLNPSDWADLIPAAQKRIKNWRPPSTNAVDKA